MSDALIQPPNRFPAMQSGRLPNPAVAAYGGFKPMNRTGVTGPMSPASLVVAPVTEIEPPLSVPIHKRARLSGWAETPALAPTMDVEKIQAVLRAAERGDVTQLFTLYRDMELNFSHLQNEWQKRKASIVGKPHVLIPADKNNAQDVAACEFIADQIDYCENWEDGLIHLLSAQLYPLAVVEKIFLPSERGNRFDFRRFDPVNYLALSFKLPYLATGGFNLPPFPNAPAPNSIPLQIGRGGDTVWNPDSWEPDLRFFRTFENGFIDYSWANMYAPDPMRHMIHRANFLTKSIRDNYGGVMRSILFWWLFYTLGRDWFARGMDKWGSPFIMAKANTQSVDTVNMLYSAFSDSTKLGALVVNKDAAVELVNTQYTSMAEAYTSFLDFIRREISNLVSGHELTSTTKGTGLGSGVADLQGDSKEDIRSFDQLMLGRRLKRDLFDEMLFINGIPGRSPSIVWGGMDANQTKTLMDSLTSAKSAGLQLTDEAIEDLSQKTSLQFERAPEPEPAMAGTPKKKNAK